MDKRKTYQVKGTNQALEQLHQLVSEMEGEKIQELTEEILSQDPYNNLKYIERKIRPNKQINIKRLEGDGEGSGRLRYKKYRIVYEILEKKISIRVFKFDNRFNVYRNLPSEDDKDSSNSL